MLSKGRVSTDVPILAIAMSFPLFGPRVSRTIRVPSGEKGLLFISSSTLNDTFAALRPSSAAWQNTSTPLS